MKKKLLFIFLLFFMFFSSCKKEERPTKPIEKPEITYNVPIWHFDFDTIGVSDDAQIIIENYENLNDFNISCSSDIIEAKSSYVTGLKEGSATVTLTHKQDSSIFSTKDITVIKKPEFKVEDNLMVGGIYDFAISNVTDYDISFSKDSVDIFNNYLICKEIGEVTITIKDKLHPNVKTSEKLVINEFKNEMEKPVLNMKKTYIEVGNLLLIRFKNYNLIKDFDIITNTLDKDGNPILSIDNANRINGITPTKQIVYVRHKLDHSITTSFELSITGKVPKLFVSREILNPNDLAYITISNLSETLENSIDDFILESSDDSIIKVEDGIIKAIKIGSALIKATSKQDPLVFTSITINVVDASVSRINLLINVEEEYTGTTTPGSIYQLILTHSDGTVVSPEDYNFSSSNDEFIRHIGNGKICLVNPGFASISAYRKDNPLEKATFRFNIEGTSNVDYVNTLLTIALGEKGYVERYNAETGEYVNDTKYNHWYNMEGAWCAMFVSWCWYFSGLSNDLLVKYCSCSAGKAWCESKGIFKYKENYHPKSGDIIFFLSSGSSHTGIVVYADDNYVYTIEGNASNRVDCWRWSLNDARITGYGVPEYPSFNGTRKDFSWIVDSIYKDGKYWWTNVPEKHQTL